jgi:adenylate kinase family enzyme
VLDDRDNPELEARWYAESPEAAGLNQELESFELELENDTESRLARVVSVLDLAPRERNVLHACLAVALEPSLAQIFGHLHNRPDWNYLSEAIVAQLFQEQPPILSQNSALVRWGAVRVSDAGPGQPAPLVVDPHLLEFISGREAADPLLLPLAVRARAEETFPDWPVERLVAQVRRAWANGVPTRVVVTGPPGSGRRTLAASVARALGIRLVALDASRIADDAWPSVCLRAYRQALLIGGAVAWCNVSTERRHVSLPKTPFLEFVTGESDLELPPVAGSVDEWVAMPSLTVDQRRALWKRLLPEANSWPEPELEHLAERYSVQLGDIVTIGRRGASTLAEAREACRKVTRHRLGDLAELLACPFGREDLTLPPKLHSVLDDFLFEARERVRFWEEQAARRLFPRGRGLVALMTGTPGTGKTMAAQVIAAELGLDLFRIDLAASVSKYIGETAKNLRRIFARAAEMNAVLLFDEADALFSKRTDVKDAHDRYANTDTNYLLQLLEGFDGIALLASNKRQNIDLAFVRRLRYVMDFPRPDAAERLRIWQRLVRELLGVQHEAALAPLLQNAAQAVELSGAQIKLALLGGIFAARQAGAKLDGAHLCVGIEREVVKAGRSLGLKEREMVEGHG